MIGREPKDKKSEQIGIRMTPALKKLWEQIAARGGRAASDLMRELLYEYMACYVPAEEMKGLGIEVDKIERLGEKLYIMDGAVEAFRQMKEARRNSDHKKSPHRNNKGRAV